VALINIERARGRIGLVPRLSDVGHGRWRRDFIAALFYAQVQAVVLRWAI